jgi:hypothetical protein
VFAGGVAGMLIAMGVQVPGARLLAEGGIGKGGRGAVSKRHRSC